MPRSIEKHEKTTLRMVRARVVSVGSHGHMLNHQCPSLHTELSSFDNWISAIPTKRCGTSVAIQWYHPANRKKFKHFGGIGISICPQLPRPPSFRRKIASVSMRQQDAIITIATLRWCCRCQSLAAACSCSREDKVAKPRYTDAAAGNTSDITLAIGLSAP